VSDKTLDYDGEAVAPRPVSKTVDAYLRKSISLSDILKRLVRGWFLALVGTVIGVLAGVYTVWITPPTYTVTLTLLPLDSGSAEVSGNGGVGLQVLAGLLGNSGPVPKFTRFVASFYSTRLAAELDRKYDAVCDAFQCDKKTHSWPKHGGFYAWVIRAVTDIAHLPGPDRPRTADDLSKFIQSNVTITSDKNTNMLALGMDTDNPAKASRFLVRLVETANDFVKDQDNAVVKKEVAYVTAQLKTNTDLSQRDALTRMLEDQEQHLMLTAINLPYVASIQDGPTVEVSNRSIKFLAAFTLFGFLIGGGIGVALSFVPEQRRFWRRSWNRS
jgi:hypothetical protein